MNRKHYLVIARAIADKRYSMGMEDEKIQKVLTDLSILISVRVAEINTKLDQREFLKACGQRNSIHPTIVT